MFGLKPQVIEDIKKVFSMFPEIETVILYGSRAKGNYKNGSDIDITLKGINLNLKTIYAVSDKLDELNLPYTFDISIYSKITNIDLLEHISRAGKTLYSKL